MRRQGDEDWSRSGRAKQLKKHLGLLSFCQSLLPDRIGDCTDDELEAALMRITESSLSIPAETCLGILTRSVARDVGLLKGAFSSGGAAMLLNRLRLFHLNPEELVFDYSKRTVAPLMQIIPFAQLRQKWTTWVFEHLLVPMVEDMQGDSHIFKVEELLRRGVEVLGAPDRCRSR